MVRAPLHNCIAIVKMFNILIALLLLSSCLNKPHPDLHGAPTSVSNRPKTHVVIPGETLFSIAWRYGLTYEVLANHNGISPPYIIRPSQVIDLDINATGRHSVPTTASKSRSSVGQKHAGNASSKDESASQKKQNSSINKTGEVAKAGEKPIVWAAPKWGWPAKGVILSSFQGNTGLNKGIDLGGKLGEPVVAAASGQVVYSGSGLRGYGKLLIIKHNETFLSAYAHNDKLLVKEGDFVKAGQRIADMGSSGTDRVKLHFEIRRDGTPVNPLQYLPRR